MVIKNFTPEGKSIGELLYSLDAFEVPPYQRDYSWQKEDLEDFWKDINKANTDDYHFFGSMLFQTVIEGDNKRNYVIDGQQRFTTISILLAVIRDLLNSGEIDDKVDASINHQYLIKKITGNRQIKKFTLNLRNRDFFYHFACNFWNTSTQNNNCKNK